MLRFEHVSLSYGSQKIIDDISFEIQEGQMAVLIGSLFLFHHILEHRTHAAAGLPTGTVDRCDDGHVSHRPLQQHLERTLDVGVEGTGLLDIHGGDSSHVG